MRLIWLKVRYNSIILKNETSNSTTRCPFPVHLTPYKSRSDLDKVYSSTILLRCSRRINVETTRFAGRDEYDIIAAVTATMTKIICVAQL